MSIDKYRQEIDVIDNQLIELVEKRLLIAIEIGKMKKSKKLSIYYGGREQLIRERFYRTSSLTKDRIDQLYNIIFKISRDCQNEI